MKLDVNALREELRIKRDELIRLSEIFSQNQGEDGIPRDYCYGRLKENHDKLTGIYWVIENSSHSDNDEFISVYQCIRNDLIRLLDNYSMFLSESLKKKN